MPEQFRTRRGYRLREAVNLALREGLLRLQQTSAPRPYRTPEVSLGQPRLPDLDDISGVLAAGEGEEHR